MYIFLQIPEQIYQLPLKENRGMENLLLVS